VPGSPDDDAHPNKKNHTLHPLAWLLSLALLGSGLAMTQSWVGLLAGAAVFCLLSLRAERKELRGEVPLLLLALLLFGVHVLAAGKEFRAALAPAAVIALRLLALLYLLRWSARVALGGIARWLMAKRPPARPRFLLLLVESARLTAGLLPLSLREAEQHGLALRGRGIRPGPGLPGLCRYLLAWFLPFLGTMLRVGDAYAEALTARGYVPGRARRSGQPLSWGGREWAAILASALVTVGYVRGL
jgi:energy-coupling factor transporter transmembrane protein EcfT